MLLIPAIDLKDGQCVRLRQGRMDDSTVFSSDPVAMAAHWKDQGARRLHIVDLDGAFAGVPRNGDLIREMIAVMGDVPVQVGGGIRTEAIIEAYLDAGVQGLILEANYEWEMLEADQKRPFSTKQRISSQHGHLSNEQAADLVAELVPDGLKRLILGHLSSDCNSPTKAVEVVRQRISTEELEICVASQNEVTPWQTLEEEIDPAFYGELFDPR